MARPRRDGTKAREANRRKLSDKFVQSAKPEDRLLRVWDTVSPGLALVIQPSGKKAFKVAYRTPGRLVWYHLDDARKLAVDDARQRARKIATAVSDGRDPAAERKAEREKNTFADVAAQYVEEHASKRNKSWKQAEALVAKHLIPKWGKLKAHAITRAEVRAMIRGIKAPILANQVLFAAGAIFNWAIREEIIKDNPCKLVTRNPTTARERVLSDNEIKLLWPQLDTQLRLILLTGQRPGEVAAMRREDIDDAGWWNLPGKPTGTWPGTKNGRDHWVWLAEPARVLIDQHLEEKIGAKASGKRMAKIVAKANIKRATPHDLRRTCLTMITRLKFGRDAMDRIANHRTNGVTDVYDRHPYLEEDEGIMAEVARLISTLVEDKEPAASNVISIDE